MSRVGLVVLAVLWLMGCTAVAAGSSAAMKNCDLRQPPPDAGEDGVHGTLLKVFPRKSRIDAAYSGCQTIWAQDGEGWSIVMIGFFESGEVVRMRFPSKPGDAVEQCSRKAGVLVKGYRDICSAMDAFPYSSEPPGCLITSKGSGTSSAACAND